MLGASANAASGRAVVGWFGPGERGLALGMRHMATPAGGAVAAALLPLAVAAGGLDAALLALAGGCLAGSVAAAIWLREAPGRRPRAGPLTPAGRCATRPSGGSPRAPRWWCWPRSRS